MSQYFYFCDISLSEVPPSPAELFARARDRRRRLRHQRHAKERLRTSAPRTSSPENSSKSPRFSALVPSLVRVRLELVNAFATTTRCARHAGSTFIRLLARRRPRFFVLARDLLIRSSRRLGHILRISSKDQHPGRTSRRASCNRLSRIREHDWVRSMPAAHHDGRLLRAGSSASIVRGRYAVRLPGGRSPSSPLARLDAQPLATPTLTSLGHPSSRIGDIARDEAPRDIRLLMFH